jgi:hypothetical protein
MRFASTSRRSLTTRGLAVSAAAAAALGAFAFSANQADAAVSTLVSITKVNVHHVAALTANQVITVTGTGFDEDVITGVAINGCTTAPTYVVSSPTTLLLKTADDCATTSTGVITITDTSSNTAVSVPGATGGAMALSFVAAPTIATASATVKPVVTENSQGAAFANQNTTANTKGGTVIRVKAGTTPFVNSTAYPLSATLDGVALTKVTMPTNGTYFTGVVGAHAADAAPMLKVTSNGVTKSFLYGAGGSSATAGTHDFQYAGTGITVSPASGPINGGTVLTVTGSGFTTGTTVTVGGTSCPVTGTTTATIVKCTTAVATAPGAKDVKTTTGSVTSVVGTGSTFTFLDQ